MNKWFYVLTLFCSGTICGVSQATDEFTIVDIYNFFQRQPYRIVAVEQSTGLPVQVSEHFLPVSVSICSPDSISRDSSVLFHSQIKLQSRVVFTFIPVGSDSVCEIRSANGQSLMFYETDSAIAPNNESASIVREEILKYGQTLQEYNHLRAVREDPRGIEKLGLSVILGGLGVYGILDPDDRTKLAGSLAVLVSSFGIVSSIRQIEDEHNRENRIIELALHLKIGF